MTHLTKKLGEVVKIQNGFAFKSTEYTDSGFFVMRIANVQDGRIEMNDPKFIKQKNNKSFGQFVLHAGDILISLTGNVGRVGIIQESHLPAVLNQRVARIIVTSPILDKDYLFLFLRSPYFFDQVVAGGKGMAQKNVSTKQISAIEIPLPPIAEQRRIVAKIEKQFAKIDEAARLRAESETLAAELLPATLHEIFSSAESKGWEMKMIDEVCEHPQYGFTASASREPAGPKFLRITDIQNGHVDWSLVPYCKCDSVEKHQLKSGDLVFARTGATVGKSYLISEVPDEAVFASYLIRLRAKQITLPEFLYYFFQSPNYWEQINTGKAGMQPNVNGTKLAKIKIPLPALAEQKAIVKKLDTLAEKAHTLASLQSSQSADLKSLKQSILHEAFSGGVE